MLCGLPSGVCDLTWADVQRDQALCGQGFTAGDCGPYHALVYTDHVDTGAASYYDAATGELVASSTSVDLQMSCATLRGVAFPAACDTTAFAALPGWCAKCPDPTTGGGAVPANGAGGIVQTATPLVPDLLIVLSRAASMGDNAGGQPCPGGCGASSKWALATAAIDAAVAATGLGVVWGLELSASEGSACTVTSGPAVPLGIATADAIASALSASSPGSGAPTTRGVVAAVAVLQASTDLNDRSIVLVTDGLSTCMPGNPDPTADDTAGAELAVADALAVGFPTYVVGVGAPTATESTALDQLATNGGRPQSGGATTYFAGATEADLATSLNEIVAQATAPTACAFDLGPLPDSGSATVQYRYDFISVSADGVPLARDPTHTSGWDYIDSSETRIRLFGPSCDSVVSVSFFPCVP